MSFNSSFGNKQASGTTLKRRLLPHHCVLTGSFAAVLAVAAITGATAQTPPPPNVPASADDTNELIAVFHVAGQTSQIGPVNDIFQVTNGFYSLDTPLQTYKAGLVLPGYGSQKPPELRVSLGKLDSQLQSQPTQGAGGQTEILYASTSYDTAVINLVVPAISGAGNAVVLSIKAAAGAATASGTLDTQMGVFSGGSYMGLSSMSGMVSGSLVGGKTVVLSSSAPANDVIYNSKTVTVTQNVQEIINGTSCDPVTGGCSSVQRGIRMTGLRIALSGAVIAGHAVSGEIDLPIATVWTQDPKQ